MTCGVLTRFQLADLPALGTPLHLAIGFFDGVHLGHQTVIRGAVDAAARDGGMAGVVTFHPHPCYLTRPDQVPAQLLADLEHKAEVIRRLGAGLFVPLTFDRELAAIDAESFVRQLTAAPVRTVAVGEDWRFGCGRLGDVALLRAHGERAGFAVLAMPMVTLDGERISSTRIRQAVRDGALAAAETMLGRPYTIRGPVLHGRHLAHQLGYPTANIDPGAMVMPPEGVWAVRASCAGHERLPGVANLGMRPTVDGQTRRLEVHLFDFQADLYGRPMEVEFARHLRPEICFPSLEALKEQIMADAAEARRWLLEHQSR